MSLIARDNDERFVVSMLSWTGLSRSVAGVEVEKDRGVGSCIS